MYLGWYGALERHGRVLEHALRLGPLSVAFPKLAMDLEVLDDPSALLLGFTTHGLCELARGWPIAVVFRTVPSGNAWEMGAFIQRLFQLIAHLRTCPFLKQIAL